METDGEMPVIDTPLNDDEEQFDAEGPESEEVAADALGLDDVEEGPFSDDEEEGNSRVIELEEEVADLKDKLLRALADAENIRRRAERDKMEASKYAITGFARDIVSVSDNLRRALDSVDEEARKKDEAFENLFVGIEMTEREMLNTFERYNVQTIEALGKPFDHNRHEALFEVEDTEKVHGTVVQVVQSGYILHDRLLRPAKVGISKGGPKQALASEKTDESVAELDKKAAASPYENQGDAAGTNLDEKL
ncbi:MAG: nucleotide exchange factor GrpE [Rhodospirillales bacterium]